MRVIFLGAGEGKRLHPYTLDRPKWLLALSRIPLMEQMVACVNLAGATQIVLVCGRHQQQIKCPSVVYAPYFEGHNMVHSLFVGAPEYMSGDVLVSYADILYEPEIVEQLMASRAPISVVVDMEWYDYFAARSETPAEIAESLVLQGNDILEIGQPLQRGQMPRGQYVGLMKFSQEGAACLTKLYWELHAQFAGKAWRNARLFEDAYFTDFLQELIDRGIPVEAFRINRGWLELDTVGDYERALAWQRDETISRYIRLDKLPIYASVVSAGGIVLRRHAGRLELLVVGDGAEHKWRLPKGMQVSGEMIQQTAIREVREETGIDAAIVGPAFRTSWRYKYAGEWWDEHVHFFLMREVSGKIDDHDSEFKQVEWMKIEEAKLQLRYVQERQPLEEAEDYLTSAGEEKAL